jgi:hypothetical protein
VTLPVSIPSLWSWQFLSWFIGLALVYVVSYRLQPVFTPELPLSASLNPLRRRFRVKARTRKVEATAIQPDGSPSETEKQADQNKEKI